MIQEDKDLLLRDLCARLPYGVKAQTEDYELIKVMEINIEDDYIGFIPNYNFNKRIFNLFMQKIQEVKPYLFPLSSMTDEQKREFHNDLVIHDNPIIEAGDWLYAHHFDVHGLLDKGLAIDATNLNIY